MDQLNCNSCAPFFFSCGSLAQFWDNKCRYNQTIFFRANLEIRKSDYLITYCQELICIFIAYIEPICDVNEGGWTQVILGLALPFHVNPNPPIYILILLIILLVCDGDSTLSFLLYIKLWYRQNYLPLCDTRWTFKSKGDLLYLLSYLFQNKILQVGLRKILEVEGN